MPELIEVERYREAAEAIVGDMVTEVVTIDPRYPRDLPIGTVIEALTGATVEGVRRHGKLMLVDTDRSVIGLRFGMTGRLLVDGHGPIDRLEYGAATDDRKWDRLVLRLASGRTLAVNDPRRFGAIEVDPDESRLGADAATITADALDVAVGSSTASLKSRLLDQRRVAGLGNLLVDETLWRGGFAPGRRAGGLDPADRQRLATTIRSTVRTLTRRGGSHTGDLQSERLLGGRCPRDGAELHVDQIGGRTTYWCPEHQE